MKNIVVIILLIVVGALGVMLYDKKNNLEMGVSTGAKTAVENSESVEPAKVLTEVEKLTKRVEGRWAAFLKEDFDKVYEYATPAYRKSFGKTHFFNQYGGQILRTGTKIAILEIDKDNPDEAKVAVEIFFRTDGYNGSTFSNDTWKKVNGEWWMIETK